MYTAPLWVVFTGAAHAAPCDGKVSKELKACLSTTYPEFSGAIETKCASAEEGYHRWKCRQTEYAALGVVIDPLVLRNGPPVAIAASPSATPLGPTAAERALNDALLPASTASVLAHRLPKADYPTELSVPADLGFGLGDLGRFYEVSESGLVPMSERVSASADVLHVDRSEVASGTVSSKVEVEAGLRFMGLGASGGTTADRAQQYTRALWTADVHRIPAERVALLQGSAVPSAARYYLAEIHVGAMFEIRCLSSQAGVSAGVGLPLPSGMTGSIGGSVSGSTTGCVTRSIALEVRPGETPASAHHSFSKAFAVRAPAPVLAVFRRVPDAILAEKVEATYAATPELFFPFAARGGMSGATLVATSTRIGGGSRQLWQGRSNAGNVFVMSEIAAAYQQYGDQLLIGYRFGDIDFRIAGAADEVSVSHPATQSHRVLTAKQFMTELGGPTGADAVQAMLVQLENMEVIDRVELIAFDTAQLKVYGIWARFKDE